MPMIVLDRTVVYVAPPSILGFSHSDLSRASNRAGRSPADSSRVGNVQDSGTAVVDDREDDGGPWIRVRIGIGPPAAVPSVARARADTLTPRERLRAEILRLSGAGCHDLLLFPRSGDLDQVALLAEALDREGEME
jgi:hypothetical protein